MRLRKLTFFISVLFISFVYGQTIDPLKVYRKEKDKATILEHTKLECVF